MGGGSDSSDSGGYDAAPMQYQARKSRQKREEKALGGASGGSYVTSGGNNIVRSSSGAGVLTSSGVQRREAFQEQEFMQSTSGTATGRQTLREGAIFELEKRKDAVLPGVMGVVQRLSLQRQIDALRSGGDPVKRMTNTGGYVTVGVTDVMGRSLGQGSDGRTMAGLFNNTGGEGGGDSGTARTPEVTPEVVPDDSTLMTQQSRGRQRTRGKRFGGAGTYDETGILVRNTQR